MQLPKQLAEAYVGAGAWAPAIHSIPHVVALMRDGPEAARFARLTAALPEADTRTLILRLATTTEPAVLWSIHRELDDRNIPPCLRWPGPRDPTPQVEFVTFAADILWLCRRDSTLSPAYKGWRNLIRSPIESAEWHAILHRQFLYAHFRTSLAFWCSNGLGLTTPQRLDLMTLPTKAMVVERRLLRPDQLRSVSDELLAHAKAHRDRAGAVSPEVTAARREALWCVYILSGRNRAATAVRWTLLTGQVISRQAVSKQINIVEDVLDDVGR